MNFDQLIDKHRGLPGEVATGESVAPATDPWVLENLTIAREREARRQSLGMAYDIAEACRAHHTGKLAIPYQILDAAGRFQGLRFRIESVLPDQKDPLLKAIQSKSYFVDTRQSKGRVVLIDVYTLNKETLRTPQLSPEDWLTAIIDSRAENEESLDLRIRKK